MLPILVSLGPIKIYSFGVFLAIGLFLALYFWWKMGRDEHWEEIALFDSFFLSLIIFGVVGRIAYVAMHMADLGTLYRSLAILAFPGINVIAGIVAVIIFLILFAREHGWQEWRVADAFSVTLSLTLVFGAIGNLLNQSKSVWQLSVWMLGWAVITFAVVSRVRKNFRFYSWYKGESSTVQEGLACLVLVLLSGIYYLGLRQYLVGLLLAVASGVLIYKRAGRRSATVWGKLMKLIRRS